MCLEALTQKQDSFLDGPLDVPRQGVHMCCTVHAQSSTLTSPPHTLVSPISKVTGKHPARPGVSHVVGDTPSPDPAQGLCRLSCYPQHLRSQATAGLLLVTID